MPSCAQFWRRPVCAYTLYTSPHLVRFNERFRLGGKGEGRLASDEELSSALNECERANAGAPITVFEVTTAAGFLLFARNPADVLLLEVGMGGRLDATNVVDRPLASVITPVSLDHAEHLGDSIGKIAVEKAGILKPDVPAIVAAQPREALLSIERQAARVKAPIRIAGEDWMATEERGRLVYQDDAGLLDLPAPKLYGRHQFENAGVAIAALRARRRTEVFRLTRSRPELPRPIGRRACSGSRRDGLRRSRRPAANSGLMAATIPTAAVPLPMRLADLEERVSRPLVLVVGMLATKDCESFLKNFAGLARRTVGVPIPYQDKSFPADTIADIARSVGIPAQSSENVEAALAAIGRFELRAAAAHPDHRLALSRRRRPQRKRHHTGVACER